MRKPSALIVGGGEISLRELEGLLDAGMIGIGVDGGALALERQGCTPAWVVGDFDSLGAGDLERMRAGGARIKAFPRAKDQTDMEIALELAAELGAGSAAIFGATGSRLDHTLTNLGLLRRAASLGLEAVIHAPGQQIMLITRGMTVLDGFPGRAVSLVPITPEVRGVKTEGLLFPLKRETLYLGRSRGVHNEFLGGQASVELEGGELAVFLFAPDWQDNVLPTNPEDTTI